MRVVRDSASCRASMSRLHGLVKQRASRLTTRSRSTSRVSGSMMMSFCGAEPVMTSFSAALNASVPARAPAPRRDAARRSATTASGADGALRVGGGDSAGLGGERGCDRLDLRAVAERCHDRLAIAGRAVTGKEDAAGTSRPSYRAQASLRRTLPSARPPRRAVNRYRARRTLRRDERRPRARSCEPAPGRAAPAGRSLRARRPARSSAAGERQPLHGRDADAQAGKRSGTGNDGQQIDGIERPRRPPRACARPPPEDARRAWWPRRRSTQSGPAGRRARAVLPERVVVSMARMRREPPEPSLEMLYSGTSPQTRASRAAAANAVARRATESPLLNGPAMSSPPITPAGATPAMRQFFEAKRQYRDAIVFFRMGDFYEMFYEDALTAARALELTLTSRAKDASGGAIPMCGVPVSRRRRLRGAAGAQGLSRRHLRADGGSARRPRASSGAKSCAWSRPARSPMPSISTRASRRS